MSRPRSAPAAKPKAAAKPRAGARQAAGGARGVYVQTAKSDIYVVMLGISLGAVLLGCLFLLLEWKKYDFSLKASMTETTSSALVADAAELIAKPLG